MDILHPGQFQFLPRTKDTRPLNALGTVLDNVRLEPLPRGMYTRTLDAIILRYDQPQTHKRTTRNPANPKLGKGRQGEGRGNGWRGEGGYPVQ